MSKADGKTEAPEYRESADSRAIEVLTTKGEPDVTGADIDRFEVTMIQHLQSQDAKYHSLLVKGGHWKRWGFRAWPEVLPPSIKLEDFELGKEITDIPADLKIAYARVKKSENKDTKVIAFAKIVS